MIHMTTEGLVKVPVGLPNHHLICYRFNGLVVLVVTGWNSAVYIKLIIKTISTG